MRPKLQTIHGAQNLREQRRTVTAETLYGQDDLILTRGNLECYRRFCREIRRIWLSGPQIGSFCRFLLRMVAAAGADSDAFFLRFVRWRAEIDFGLIYCGRHKLSQGIDIPRSP